MSYLKCNKCDRAWTHLSTDVCPMLDCGGVCEAIEYTTVISAATSSSMSTKTHYDLDPDNESLPGRTLAPCFKNQTSDLDSIQVEDQDGEDELLSTVAEVDNYDFEEIKIQLAGIDAHFARNRTGVFPIITNTAVLPMAPRSTKNKASKARSTANRVKVIQVDIISKVQNRPTPPPQLNNAVPGYSPVSPEKPKKKKKKNRKKNKADTSAVSSDKTPQKGPAKFNVDLPLPECLQPQNPGPKRPMNFAGAATKPMDFSKMGNEAGGWTTVGNNGRNATTGAWRTPNASSHLFSKPGGAFGRDPEDEVNEDFINVHYGVRRSKYLAKRVVPRE